YSDLAYSCAACNGTAPTFTKGAVSPKKAGSLSFTPLGVLFSPAPDYTGAVKLSFALRDQFGTQSRPTVLTATVVPGTSKAPTTIPDAATVADGTARGNLLANDAVDAKHPATVASCGHPFNGTVECDADGSFVYTPKPGFTGVDEFAYHLFTKDTGDQVAGAV